MTSLLYAKIELGYPVCYMLLFYYYYWWLFDRR